tara:strand:+ start:43 stop:177 length:135 start_codon:yes stop_codon:yes gene_type:complete
VQFAQYETYGNGRDEYTRYDPDQVYHTKMPSHMLTAMIMIQNIN